MKKSSTKADPSPPPIPGIPDAPRSVHLDPGHLVALAILGFIVVAALAGAFSARERELRVTVGGLDVRVSYTSRSRLLQQEILAVTVANPSPSPADSVSVAVDTAYMANFVEIAMTPQPEFPYVAHLVAIPPGAQREVRVMARADRSGRHHGSVKIGVRADTVTVPLSTFILP